MNVWELKEIFNHQLNLKSQLSCDLISDGADTISQLQNERRQAIILGRCQALRAMLQDAGGDPSGIKAMLEEK